MPEECKKGSFWINIPLVYISMPFAAVLSHFYGYELGLWTCYFSFLNAFSHVVMFFMFGRKYNPGLVASITLNIPFAIYGISVIGPLLSFKANVLKTVILSGRDIDLDIEKIEVSEKVMNTISDINTNIIGVCEIVDNKIDLNSNVIILDGVQDPGNLGTIIRSAVAFNVKNIVLSKTSVDLYNTKVLRGCQGMNFHLNII